MKGNERDIGCFSNLRPRIEDEELRDEKRKRVKDEAKLDCEEGEVPPSPPASKKVHIEISLSLSVHIYFYLSLSLFLTLYLS